MDATAATVARVAKDYATNGLDYTVSYHYNPASRRRAKVNGELEAYVIQLACGKAPEGYVDWTLELLTRGANKKGVAEPVSKETICVMFKKMDSNLGKMSIGASPPKENAAFVACMENILHIYSLPSAPEVPVICMDERPYQLIGEAREPLAARPGDIKKLDAEYKRCGTCSIFVSTEALAG